MKRINFTCDLIAVVCLMITSVAAEETVFDLSDTRVASEMQVHKEQSIGIVFGESAGLNKERWPGKASVAASAPIAWSFIGINSFQLHADCLSHNYDLIKTRQLLESLSFYYGIGGRMKLKGSNSRYEDKDEDARFGMRSPLGISYAFQENPVVLFAEVVPILDIVPETRLGVGVGIGARYYFSLL